jgi:cell division protein FtsA
LSRTILGIDIGSTKICAIIAQINADSIIKIAGSGLSKSKGIKKGIITNIEQSSNSIKEALDEAKRVAGTNINKVLVSISGAYTKSVGSYGVVNIPGNDIGIKEINRVMMMADHNANIPKEFERIHVLPYNFKVDDQEFIDDPLGMNGNRLEVHVHIITAQKSSLNNLKKAVELAGIKIDNIVLNGYASSIAVLNEDEKELGAGVIDIGGATCNLAINSGNSIRYNDFLAVGSNNITNDLSMALHTPLSAAENVKIKYGSLKKISSELVELPVIGDDNNTNEVSLEIVSNVIYARAEETLMILAKSIDESGFKDQMGAGIVLTGGFTKLEGLRELSVAIFDNMPVRIAKPKKVNGMFESLKDPIYSIAIGLILYGGGSFTPYEIDSNKKLRYKNEIIEPSQNIQNILEDINDVKIEEKSREDDIIDIKKIKKENGLKEKFLRFWNMITQLF